jgi:hypothetical protein
VTTSPRSRRSFAYEPIGALQVVADDIWIADGPVVRMAFPLGMSVPFPTRMTVVRLSEGGLWIHSPIQLSPALAAQIDVLGPVAHLVSPNFIHYAGIPEWSRTYPHAVTWASPGVRERAASQKLAVHFQKDLGDEPPVEWRRELDQLLFLGSSVLREVVFFHRASRTLILADLIENFELDRVAAPWRWLLQMTGSVHPDGKAPIDMRMTFRNGRNEARKCRERMIAWQPERVVLSHGKWYERDGVAELRRAFRWLD